MNRLPVASAFLQAAQDIRIGGRWSNALYQYTIQSDNSEDLNKWGPILLAEDEEASRVSGREFRPAERRPCRLLNYDRVTAAQSRNNSAGLDSSSVQRFRPAQVSIIYTQLNQYYVVLEVAPPYWQDPRRTEEHLS